MSRLEFGPVRSICAGRLAAKVRGACSSNMPTLASTRRIRNRASSLAPVSRAKESDTVRGPAASQSGSPSSSATCSALDAT